MVDLGPGGRLYNQVFLSLFVSWPSKTRRIYSDSCHQHHHYLGSKFSNHKAVTASLSSPNICNPASLCSRSDYSIWMKQARCWLNITETRTKCLTKRGQAYKWVVRKAGPWASDSRKRATHNSQCPILKLPPLIAWFGLQLIEMLHLNWSLTIYKR